MLVIIDNYDSFTYNIYHLFGVFYKNIKIVKNDEMSISELMSISPSAPSAFIISPGPHSPSEAGVCLGLISHLKTAGIPLLGVCLGHQAIIQAFGGKVVNLQKVVHGKPDTIELIGTKSHLFEGVEGKFIATRYHSLAADPKSLPKTLHVTSFAKTDNCIMSVEHYSSKVFGLQFHPESILSKNVGPRIASNFLKISNLI